MAEQQKFTVHLPLGLDAIERARIAAEMIRKIQQRTIKGLNVIGRNFVAYIDPKKYPGKRKPHTPVNLKLTSKMLKAMKHLKGLSDDDKITIGYAKNTKQNAKAEGNQLGTYGQKSPVQTPRKFLGITKKLATEIIKRHAPDISKAEINRETEVDLNGS